METRVKCDSPNIDMITARLTDCRFLPSPFPPRICGGPTSQHITLSIDSKTPSSNYTCIEPLPSETSPETARARSLTRETYMYPPANAGQINKRAFSTVVNAGSPLRKHA
ncbi:hypothetical protein J6590_021545 [Homalodisca vitripennis]|nr:hypothetical protein J6590_021545 [Homalodisca vitripennis]